MVLQTGVLPAQNKIFPSKEEGESDRDVITGLPSLRLLRRHFTLGNLVRRRQSLAESKKKMFQMYLFI